MAAGTITFTETRLGPVKRIKAAWTSGSGGESAVGTTTYAYNGKCELLTTVPTDTPTDNYDVTAVDADSVDVLAGAGANRDTTNTEQVLGTSLGAVAGSALTFTIANAGNSKNGVVYLDVR